MKEFYLKQLNVKNKIKGIARKLHFYSSKSRQILFDWVDSVSTDWPISRRRYYATEIPLWYCASCNYVYVPKKGKYHQPWKDKCPIKRCLKCGHEHFDGETRVFDTWFDSSISPLFILMYERDNNFFKKSFPCSLRPQGKEIVRTWLYYTLLKSYLLTGKSVFQDVWVNYHIVDDKGVKMSKSKGNVIDPQEVIKRYGAEPFRLWAATEGNLVSTDFRCSFERIEGAGKTLTKLWNVARFISIFPEVRKPKRLQELDRWIINEVNELVRFSKERYENYDFHNPAVRIKHFIWETFASHYLELVKSRVYNDGVFKKEEQDSGIYAIHYCLDLILKLLSPINPMITYSLYKQLRNKDIHKEDFPDLMKQGKIGFNTSDVIKLNKKIWKYKKEKGLSLKDEIEELVVDTKFSKIKKDLIITHKVKNFKMGRLKIR